MSRMILFGLGVALAGCASPQRLSASIYGHQQMAADLDASGEHADADRERRAADHDRERLGALTPIVRARDPW